MHELNSCSGSRVGCEKLWSRVVDRGLAADSQLSTIHDPSAEASLVLSLLRVYSPWRAARAMQVLANFIWVTAISVKVRSLYIPARSVANILTVA
jgi:hypothetical protein